MEGTLSFRTKAGKLIKLICTLQFARHFIYINDMRGIWQGDKTIHIR